MKTFITLAVVVCLVASALATPAGLTEEQKAKASSHIDLCVKEENVSEAEATKFRNRDFADASKEFKCLATCFFEKVGSLKDGEIQDDVVLVKLGGLIGEEKTKKTLEKCKGIKGEDRCDTGFKIFQCFEAAKKEFKTAEIM